MLEPSRPQSLLLSDQQYELGKLYYEKAEFGVATEKLTQASEGYLASKNFEMYLKCVHMILRGYIERDMFDEVASIKEQIQDVSAKYGFALNSKSFYLLCICSHFKGQFENSMEYAQKALSSALEMDSKEDICYALCAIAIMYRSQGKYSEALREIYNLQVFFQFVSVPEVKLSSMLINGRILADTGKFEESLNVFWMAYEELKHHKTQDKHVQLLYNIARTYFMSGEKLLAGTYINLAEKACDPVNFKHTYSTILELKQKLGIQASIDFDLVFDLEQHAVTERKMGQIDFKNQFILLDLLKLFCQNQGLVFSKEYLVENIWKQQYDPAVHDNKIYVTIKRLRKLIEPDLDRPRYIFRAKNGYFMNKSVSVSVQKSLGGS